MKNNKLGMLFLPTKHYGVAKRLGVAIMFVFFFASTQVNAQTLQAPNSYVSPSVAVQRLNQEISEMNVDLSQLQFDTPAYEALQREIWFYEGVKRQLDNNATVADAINVNSNNLKKVAGVSAKLKVWTQDVITLLEF